MHDPRRPLCHGLLALLALAAGLGLLGAADAEEEAGVLALEAAGTPVAHSARVRAGVYRIRDGEGRGVLRVTGDGVTLDLSGVTLIGSSEDAPPSEFRGTAIEVVGAKDVTIRGARIRGFKIAVRARDAPGLTLERIDASGCYRQRLGSTPQREDPADWLWPHENDQDEWETRYGAGFSLTDCAKARVFECRVRDGQNGLLLTRCERAKVFDNDFSFNSGWGIALYRSMRCTVSRNRCDWCVRGYSHGVYARGQDSAGIIVFEQSSYNLFVRNSATHGGDGFFLYGGHETTKRTGRGGCNGNLVFENDFSHAVANAIEATFSTGNLFVRNDCSDSDHGIWAGYSSDSLFFANQIHGCTSAGISIEHGQENRIQFNRISGGRDGIHLWWDMDEAFVNGVFGKERDTSSGRNVIHGNVISGGGTGVRLVNDQGSVLRWNALSAKNAILFLGAGTRVGTVAHNHFRGPRSTGSSVPVAVRNDSGADWVVPTSNSRRGPLATADGIDVMGLPEDLGFLRPQARGPRTPPVPGNARGRLPKDMPRGRKEMRIGPWGPLDPRVPHASPREIRARGPEARVQLSGRGRFAVARIQGDVTVSSPTGSLLPAELLIRPQPREAGTQRSALLPFRVDLTLGLRGETIRGTLLDATWDVRFFQWSADPRHDAATFATLLAGTATKRETHTAIDFPWRGRGPSGLEPNHFATLATTTVWLEAGRYRFRTLSDDGVRCSVDGKRIIDNWTHHAPTEDVATVVLATGAHEIRLEHFEIDGYAVLSFDLERLP